MRATRPHFQQAEMAHDTRGDLELGDLCGDVCAGFRLVDPDKQRIQRICGLGRGGRRNGGPRFALRLGAQQPTSHAFAQARASQPSQKHAALSARGRAT
jgi:hypothetical protein